MINAMTRPSALNAILIDAPFVYCGPSAVGNLELIGYEKRSQRVVFIKRENNLEQRTGKLKSKKDIGR